MARFIIHPLMVLLLVSQLLNFSNTSASIQQNGSQPIVISCCESCSNTELLQFSIETLHSKIRQNSTEIQFCSSLRLSTTITVKGLNDIIFSSAGTRSEINCTGSENAGLEFNEVQNLVITNLTLTGCGFSFHGENGKRNTARSIYIANCINVFVNNISVNHGKGSGIVFYNTVGNNSIKRTSFSYNNVVQEGGAGAGGIHIEFKNNVYGQYNFHNCKFVENQVQLVQEFDLGYIEYGVGRGGGMMVFFRGSSANIAISIMDCLYEGNSAMWGGGMYVLYADESTNNSITIVNSTFRNNRCVNAGGGIDIGLEQETSANKFMCTNCTFAENRAKIGGGAALFSILEPTCTEQEKTVVLFKNCTWIQNVAEYGAAVDLSPQHAKPTKDGEVPETMFVNCNFTNNMVSTLTEYCNKPVEYMKSTSFTNGCHNQNGKGTLLVTDFHVHFSGATTFDGNTGSAVYAISSDLIFNSGSTSEFKRNSGTSGGAIALIGISAIVIHSNSSLVFTNNTAMSAGGAIFYFSFDHHDYVFSHNCFIKYSGSDHRNITMYFDGNKAITSQTAQNRTEIAHYGNSIHAMTMIPCFKVWHKKNGFKEDVSPANVFSFIGNVSFNDSNPKITSSGAFFNITNKSILQIPMHVIPGKLFELPVSLIDDFNQTVKGVYRVSIENHNASNVQLEGTYVDISHNKLQLYGQPGETATLTITAIGFREVSASIEIRLRECPPLFLPENDKCVCSRSINDTFISFHQCHNDLFEASLRNGYWIGYTDGESFKHLFYGYCPNNYCFIGLHNKRYHTLTIEASKVLLDKIVCGESRTGTVCGECRGNYSVYYHNPYFKCGPNHLCEIGWLFYVLSELLPLTLLFIVVIVFDISFTSGTLNGFIFFAQVLDSISSGHGFIVYPDSVFIMRTIAHIVYKFFNFDFFSVDELSYCLWKGATTMDVLAFKFLTVVYALALVFITIWLKDRFGKCCNRKKTSTISRSITHGLSAFLVMVHAQCTTVSFKILQLVRLSSHGSPSNHKSVVFYQGNIDYFSSKHIVYAFPALLCIVTLVAIPPIVLLVYPLCNRIIAFLKLDNLKIVSWISTKIPMVRLKPIIDTFQGCFKDEYRYFAGLYFVYRIAFIATTLVTHVTQVYTLHQLLLICVLVVHSVTWPYEKRWHNTLDGLIIFTLAVINGLSLFSFSYSLYGQQYQHYIDIASSVELVFIYGPLIYIGVYVTAIVSRKIKAKCPGKKNECSTDLWRDEDLPARLQNLDDSSDDESETDYQLYEHGNIIDNTADVKSTHF